MSFGIDAQIFQLCENLSSDQRNISLSLRSHPKATLTMHFHICNNVN